MILDIDYNEIKKIAFNRMHDHISLVNYYYKLFTNKELINHDFDKINNPIWEYYYYCRETNQELPHILKLNWINEDKKHRLNSKHHIECLTNDIELDWDELVADFFAVNKKHNRTKEELLTIIKHNYGYAYEECLKRIDLYDSDIKVVKELRDAICKEYSVPYDLLFGGYTNKT